MMRKGLLMVLLALTGQQIAFGQEIRTVDQGMSIIGDRELPRILYIVPWKPSKRESTPYSPEGTLANVILPVDPELFDNEVAYHRHIKAQEKNRGKKRR